jgi:hypothetical protein
MNRLLYVALLLAAASSTGCQTDAQTACLPGPTVLAVVSAVKAHDAVARCEVLEVGKSPGFWSGAYPAPQIVRYRVLEVYAGRLDALPSQGVDVTHVVVGKGRIEDTEPRLNPKMVRPGRQMILFLRRDPQGFGKGWFVFGDDPFGAVPLD